MACLNLSAIFRLLHTLLPHLPFHWAGGGEAHRTEWQIQMRTRPHPPICISPARRRVRGGLTRGDTSRQLHVRHTHPSLLHSFFLSPNFDFGSFLFPLTPPSLYLTCLFRSRVLVTCTTTFPHRVPRLLSQLLCHGSACQTTSFCGLSQVLHL